MSRFWATLRQGRARPSSRISRTDHRYRMQNPYSANPGRWTVLAVLAVVVLKNPSVARRIPPPGLLALAGVGQVVPPSGEISRDTLRLPLVLDGAKQDTKNSPPSQAPTVLESVEPVM